MESVPVLVGEGRRQGDGHRVAISGNSPVPGRRGGRDGRPRPREHRHGLRLEEEPGRSSAARSNDKREGRTSGQRRAGGGRKAPAGDANNPAIRGSARGRSTRPTPEDQRLSFGKQAARRGGQCGGWRPTHRGRTARPSLPRWKSPDLRPRGLAHAGIIREADEDVNRSGGCVYPGREVSAGATAHRLAGGSHARSG